MEAKQEKLKEDVEKEAKKQKKDSSKPAEPTPGVMRTSVLEIKGTLLRATNEELAARPYFKILQPQIYRTENFEPYADVSAEVTGMGRYERLAIDGSIGPATKDSLDMVDVMHHVDDKNILPRLKLVQRWVSNITIDSSHAHRDWLRTDDNCGTRKQKAKLNNLLRTLFDLECKLTFFYHKYPTINAQKIKFVKTAMLASISSPYNVPKSIVVPLLVKLRPILVNLNLLWDNDRFHFICMPRLQPRDDDSFDEDVKNEGPAGRPANAVVFSPLMNMMFGMMLNAANPSPNNNK